LVTNAEKDPAHKIATQHRLIKTLLRGLRSAIADGDASRAKRSLAGLQRALKAHFLLEEQHYFPRTREARPELETELRKLAEEHGEMLSSIAWLSSQLEEGDRTRQALGSFESAFLRHEKNERELLET
jgi:hemerythrin superfamily protein